MTEATPPRARDLTPAEYRAAFAQIVSAVTRARMAADDARDLAKITARFAEQKDTAS
jgi:hypothetical protein